MAEDKFSEAKTQVLRGGTKFQKNTVELFLKIVKTPNF